MISGIAALAVLIFVLLTTLIIARSMMRPLRLLKAGALEVAGVRLPAEVSELSRAGDTGQGLDVEPIDVHSTDEIGQVARAFDQVHREAVRLAADESKLRSSVSAMFTSLSRRSQTLLERLLRLIDSLELGEDDPERLANLFRMDHLATRMRRNSENLLLLAGHENPRKWSDAIPPAGGPSQSRSWTWSVLQCPRSSSTTGSSSASSLASPSSATRSLTRYICSPRSSRTPPCSRRRAPR